MVTHQSAVDDGPVANGHTVPDVARDPFVAVDHHLVLEVGLLADHDLIGLGPQHCPE